METAVDEVIDMIAVWHWFVPAAWAVDVPSLMATAVWRTLVWIFCADLDLVFVYMIAMRMVQMAIVQVIYVIIMLDCGVSAARAMLMIMVGVMRFVACAHVCLLCSRGRPGTSNGQQLTLHRRGTRWRTDPEASCALQNETASSGSLIGRIHLALRAIT